MTTHKLMLIDHKHLLQSQYFMINIRSLLQAPQHLRTPNLKGSQLIYYITASVHYIPQPVIVPLFNIRSHSFLKSIGSSIHYYINSFTQPFSIGLRGSWPGCPPRLFEVGQPGQQPPRLILNRDGHCSETTSVNKY